MSELINLSETSSNDTLSVISNDDDGDYEGEDDNDEEDNENETNEDEDNEGEDNDNREEDNDNREEDNNNRGAADNDEGETSKERPITSDVWDFVNRKTRKCPSCGKIFEKKTGTSSIRAHLQSHGMLLTKEKQTTLDNFVKKKATKSEKKQAVIDWIILDMQPFKVVEGKAFQNMISSFDPNFQLPTRNSIKKFIVKSFEKRKKLIIEYIKKISGKVSLTTDLWSSLNNESFLGITIHFIDESWVLRHFTLDILQFKGAHTGQSIADKIYEVLVEFGLENKTVSMTTDNASNVILSARILATKFDHEFTHYRCVAHILNIIVTAGLNAIKVPIKKLRKLIKMIRKSTKMLEELENLAKIDHQNFLRPVLDCKTRWNSTYNMLNRACILKEKIQMLAVKYNTLNSFLPTLTEWELFNDLDQFLEPFNKATIDLSTQSHPTIGHSRVILLAIKIDLDADRGQDSLLKDMIEPMKEKFTSYYEILKGLSHIAAFLDPRYKNYCFPNMSDDEVLLPIRQKLEEQQLLSTTTRPTPRVSTFLQKLKATRNVHDVVDDEVSKYWNSNEADESIHPLEWWKTHSTEYPNLSKLALDYLCIQASSVPCEQLFSIAGQVLCKSRNRLTGESVRACICLRSWILEKF